MKKEFIHPDLKTNPCTATFGVMSYLILGSEKLPENWGMGAVSVEDSSSFLVYMWM